MVQVPGLFFCLFRGAWHATCMKLIRSVNVAGIGIPVWLASPQEVPVLNGCDALYEPSVHRILVLTRCPRGRRHDVVFHEICHAAFAAMGGSADSIPDDATEERIVLKLSAILRPALLAAGWQEPDYDAEMGGAS